MNLISVLVLSSLLLLPFSLNLRKRELCQCKNENVWLKKFLRSKLSSVQYKKFIFWKKFYCYSSYSEAVWAQYLFEAYTGWNDTVHNVAMQENFSLQKNLGIFLVYPEYFHCLMSSSNFFNSPTFKSCTVFIATFYHFY